MIFTVEMTSQHVTLQADRETWQRVSERVGTSSRKLASTITVALAGRQGIEVVRITFSPHDAQMLLALEMRQHS